MTKRHYVIGTIITIILVMVGLAGCGTYGESHNYNAPAPYRTVNLRWERLESPGNYHTVIHTCFGKNGLYLTQADNNSITVIPNDPMC
jgi:hypothetical protein